MNDQEKRELMMDFERNRQMLGNVSAQKQQYQIQIEVIKASLEELTTTKEKTVMKIIGNILVNKSVTEMKKELEEQNESFELRLKTLVRQEETIIKKLNSIKAQVEGKIETKEDSQKETKKSRK
ncbi:MAG: prefoldin subunit [Candidatus ainarchaeum sp.]|nr:prefoldin subunit [Candidatus ainarchaeum sp.]